MRPHVVTWLDGVLPGTVASALAPTWFTCVGLAGVVTLFLMLAIARRHRIDAGIVASIVLWCYVGAVAAGIVMPMAIDAAQQLFTTGRIRLRWAGMTSFWGYLAGAAAVAAVCRAHRTSLARLADLAALPLGIALVIARLGCFLAGCDYGKVTSAAWALRFPSGSPAWHDHVAAGLVPSARAASLPVHPTQLYEALLGAAMAIVALYAARQPWARRGEGRVFLLTAAVYAIGRIIVEAYRGDAGRGIYLGLSSGQIFSLGVLTGIAGGWLVQRRRPITTMAAAALAVVLVTPRLAEAQRAPARPPAPSPAQPPSPSPGPVSPYGPPPQPAQPPSYGPAGQPPPQPAQPPLYAPELRPPSGEPARSMPAPHDPRMSPANAAPRGPAASAEAGARSGSSVQAGVLFGVAAPLNRRPQQVATLGGPSISVGFAMTRFSLWLDLDSFGNRDASHGTVLLSGGMTAPLGDRLYVGGRFGVGGTLVNFDEPAFRDVAGIAFRFEALVDYRIGNSWALWLRPLSFDTVSAPDLGGPITTWQLRIGLGYVFAVGRRPGPVASQPLASSPAPQPAARTR